MYSEEDILDFDITSSVLLRVSPEPNHIVDHVEKEP